MADVDKSSAHKQTKQWVQGVLLYPQGSMLAHSPAVKAAAQVTQTVFGAIAVAAPIPPHIGHDGKPVPPAPSAPCLCEAQYVGAVLIAASAYWVSADGCFILFFNIRHNQQMHTAMFKGRYELPRE